MTLAWLLLLGPPSPIDLDREGALVTTDRCPTARETVNGFQDADGCPDELPSDLRSIPGPVTGLRFSRSRDRLILSRRSDRLEQVWQILHRHPTVGIQILVTDRTLALAQQKADAVREAFTTQDDPRFAILTAQSSKPPHIDLTFQPSADTDADGYDNKFDPCPYAEGDGIVPCPGPDGDHDGLVTPDDRCPTEPETWNGFQDHDGCADTIPADLAQFVGVLVGVWFEIDRDILLPDAAPVLDRIAIALARHPTVRFELSGHSDSTGYPLYGSDIASRRARAVKDALVARGIDAHRIQTRGAGPNEPLDTNKTAAGRRRNRRIELTLLIDQPTMTDTYLDTISRPSPPTPSGHQNPAKPRPQGRRGPASRRRRPHRPLSGCFPCRGTNGGPDGVQGPR